MISLLRSSFTLGLLQIFYLVSFSQVDVYVQRGHDQPILEQTISTNGRLMASTDGHEILIWDVESGAEFGRLSLGGIFYPVRNLQFVELPSGLVLSYLCNGKILYHDIYIDQLLSQSDVNNPKRDTVSILDQLSVRFPEWRTDERQNRKYYKKLNKYQNEENELWSSLKDPPHYLAFDHADDGSLLVAKRLDKWTRKEIKKLTKQDKKIHKKNEKIAKAKEKGLLPEHVKPIDIPALPKKGDVKVVIELKEVISGKIINEIALYPSETDTRTFVRPSLTANSDCSLLLDGAYLYNPYAKNLKKDLLCVGVLEGYEHIMPCETHFVSGGKYLVTAYDTTGTSAEVLVWKLDSLKFSKGKKNSKYYLEHKDSVSFVFRDVTQPIAEL